MAMAIDAVDGTVTELPWLGKFAHENQVAVPGFAGKTVVLATEDNSDGSQLYMYVADSPADLLAGNGQLYVFKADDATGTADIAKGDELTGSFIPVDQADNVDAQTLESKVRADGAFTFIRLEDLTYDRTNPNTIYFTDTGDDEEPNLAADGTPLSLNGRLYQLTLDPADPTTVTGLTVLLDGDNGDDIHNPDNIDADTDTIMLQEDTGAGVARILAYSIADGTLTPVATLDQSDSDELVDPTDEPGAWESSGIINGSDFFGEGAWLADVQAHSRTEPQFGGQDQSGQLLLIREG
jgi:secreted PhoX family phosphatase